MTMGNQSKWITIATLYDDKNLQGAWLCYKGAMVVQLTQNTKEKNFTISIGIFDKLISLSNNSVNFKNKV